MDKNEHILICLLVVFITILFVDEGKTISLVANNLQIHRIHNQASDPEIPHHHNPKISHDDETLINSNSFELSYSSENLLLFPFYQNKKTEGFTSLIWQPPKFIQGESLLRFPPTAVAVNWHNR